MEKLVDSSSSLHSTAANPCNSVATKLEEGALSISLKNRWFLRQQNHSNQSAQAASILLNCLGLRCHHFIIYFLPIHTRTFLLRPPKFSTYPLHKSQSSDM